MLFRPAGVYLFGCISGVCVQYCLHKKNRGKCFRPYAPPLSTALRMRMDSMRLRKPSLKNRPWVNCHRYTSFYKMYTSQNTPNFEFFKSIVSSWAPASLPYVGSWTLLVPTQNDDARSAPTYTKS